MKLTVSLYGTQIGYLEGDNATFDFRFDADALDAFATNSRALSVAIPFQQRLPRHHASRRRNWFSELLPEGDYRSYLASLAGISAQDTLGFLARFGRDVAGAVEIWDGNERAGSAEPYTEPVDSTQIRAFLEDPLRWPLGNSPTTGKTSLAGIQPKVVLAYDGESWGTVHNGFPSTHILKPVQAGSESPHLFDEEFGTRLARDVGIMNYSTEIRDFDGLPVLVIERFDRAGSSRVHQEDFSQALGASGIEKYQELGGVVSLRRLADTVVRHCEPGEIRVLARQVVFAVAIGNLDLHTKNLGLLHAQGDTPRMSPAYDLVPLAHRTTTDGRLALAVNGEYRWSAITKDALIAEFQQWGLTKPEELTMGVLRDVRESLASQTPDDRAHPAMVTTLTSAVDALLAGGPIGAL
jgi:serine/threonine-protein kinase HipA